MDLTERVERQQLDESRRADIRRRDREHGGSTPHDRQREEKARSVKGWGAYKSDVTRADLDAIHGHTADPRRVTLERLFIDCGAAVRRFAPKFKRERAATLRNDALLLLVKWQRHGDARWIDLGGEGGTPLRRDWLEPVAGDARGPREKLTPRAWRALHAAVKQAAESPSARALDVQEEQEVATDPLDIAARVEVQQRDADAATRLPDDAAPELVAELLGLPLDGGRAIVARAYPAASPSALAESWGLSVASVKVSLSRGAASVRERYPHPADLLDALDAAASEHRARSERVALLALIDYRDNATDGSDALDAVRDWRGATDGLSEHERALLAATRAAIRRNGGSYGDARAERIARSIPRLLMAEDRRAGQWASRC